MSEDELQVKLKTLTDALWALVGRINEDRQRLLVACKLVREEGVTIMEYRAVCEAIAAAEAP